MRTSSQLAAPTTILSLVTHLDPDVQLEHAQKLIPTMPKSQLIGAWGTRDNLVTMLEPGSLC